jgi:hypothetical protein
MGTCEILGGFQDWGDCGGTFGFGDVVELGLLDGNAEGSNAPCSARDARLDVTW